LAFQAKAIIMLPVGHEEILALLAGHEHNDMDVGRGYIRKGPGNAIDYIIMYPYLYGIIEPYVV
jgi:hypothetical protein